MPLDDQQKSSLAYRKNEQAIWDGHAPEKYLRLLPYITGDRVLEIGSAEGVLALLLAESGKTVLALERRLDRYGAALRLQEHWRYQLGRDVGGCTMINDDIRHVLMPKGERGGFYANPLLDGVDTVVAVRSIYYLRDDIEPVFAEIGKRVPHVVLCGNQNRARWFFADGAKNNNLGRWNYYASVEGMVELLTKSEYKIVHVVKEGDPVVVGHSNPA